MKIYVLILLLGAIAAYAHLFAAKSRVENERLS
jgi:Flp pilus assembly protein TadG